jgi:hypothetical protein
MEFSWLIDGFKFYFLETAAGVVGIVTLYVFVKLGLEYRNARQRS